jgi:diguanylate cyclase (GGDEF)-like protein
LEENSTRMIKSAITAPITINGNFFGVVNVDATEIGAFTDDDLKVMQFIRDNVEIAITNHLLQEEKHILSQYDSLTGLYNRTIFEEIFEQVLEKSKRYDETFQLVLIDLNGLKVLNDRLGHTAGDQLIKQFGNTLKKITRKSDVLGRYGGDEFVAVFHYARREDLHGKLRDLLQFLEDHPFCIEGTSCTCSFSYGIATFGDDGLSLKELVQVADRRMYEFKEAYKSSHLNQHLRVISSTL